jgi:hypothetical protein
LENNLAFIDYVKAFDRVKRDKLFEISKIKNISNLLLTKNNINLFWKQNKGKDKQSIIKRKYY